MSQPFKYLNGQEIVARSGGAVSYARVLNAIRSGDLFAHKVGVSYLALEDDVDIWLAQCAKQDAPVLDPLQARIAQLEAQVVALGGVV